MLRILIEDSEGKSKLAPINPEAGDITIGRKEGNFIRLKERNVSRNHARIYQTPDGLFIEPVAARYGLKLNSSKIDGPTPLALGDEIRIGDYRLYIQDENKPNLKKEEDLNSVQDIPPEMQPRFVVISSNFAGREYHVMKTKVTIGRNTSSEICIEHQSVSGQHAEVRRNGRGDFEIRDLNSSNGTKVNGIPINEPWRLSSGDAVTLGHVTMRFCGPGDFWSLNFGINDESKGGNKGMIAIIGIAIVLVLALGFAYIGSVLRNPQQPQQPAQTSNDDNDSKDKFNEHILACQKAISNGDITEAQFHCDLARNILPNDPKYLSIADQLRKEKDSKDALNDILEYISNGDCRDAIDSLENIQKGTVAYTTMLEKDYKNKALECLEKKLRDNALAAVERGEISEAERIRDEIKSQRENSPYLAPVDEAIRKAKSASRGGGGGGSKKAAAANDAAPAPAPAPAPAAVDVNELCSNAVRAKIGKDNCKAYELYKKAKKAGITDATCKRNADTHIAAFAAQCNK